MGTPCLVSQTPVCLSEKVPRGCSARPQGVGIGLRQGVACAHALALASVLKSGHRHHHPKETHMPVIAWLLGVPLTVVILLMLFGVF